MRVDYGGGTEVGVGVRHWRLGCNFGNLVGAWEFGWEEWVWVVRMCEIF